MCMFYPEAGGGEGGGWVAKYEQRHEEKHQAVPYPCENWPVPEAISTRLCDISRVDAHSVESVAFHSSSTTGNMVSAYRHEHDAVCTEKLPRGHNSLQ